MVDPRLRARSPSFEPGHRVTGVVNIGRRRATHRGHPERLEAVVSADTRPLAREGGGPFCRRKIEHDTLEMALNSPRTGTLVAEDVATGEQHGLADLDHDDLILLVVAYLRWKVGKS